MAAIGNVGGNEACSSWLFEGIRARRVRRIVIERETPDDSRSAFGLRIDDTLVADDLTAAQAHYLAGAALDRIAMPEPPDVTSPTPEADAAVNAVPRPNRPPSWRRNLVTAQVW